MNCSKCGEPLEEGAAFCEACGQQVAGMTPAPDPLTVAPPAADEADALAEAAPVDPDDLGSSPISAMTRSGTKQTDRVDGPPPKRTCVSCGGDVGDDDYCEQCGTKAVSERDHFRETPASWVAGVCDRGIRHSRNEDGMAIDATATVGERAVLVVLDGVSNTENSHIGSLAGAKAARQVLGGPLPQGIGTEEARRAAAAKVFANAVEAANTAVVGAAGTDSPNPPSATFVAVVIESLAGGSGGTRLSYANIGDSRAYWLPDGGEGVQLSLDDSVAHQMMEQGMSREQAETSLHAHAITRWLGADAPDLTPRTGELTVDQPGWVVVCSDGLWNYASEPVDLAAQVTAVDSTDPAEVALALVGFANASGGQDNITATLARLGGAPPAPATSAHETGHNAEADSSGGTDG